MRKLSVVVCSYMALATSACGNLSNDDLLFLAAVPKKQELAMRVEPQTPDPGALTNRSPLLGQQAQYYDYARTAAEQMNKSIGNVLDMVENLGRGHRPTRRTENGRVWGPVHNLDGKGISLRLEIARETRNDGGPRFVFCVHVAPDGAFAKTEPSCAEPLAAGFAPVLSGSYEPQSESAGLRSGSGTILLDMEAAYVAGIGQPSDRGQVKVDFDFSRGGDEKQLHLEAAPAPALGQPGAIVVYDYGLTADGRVDFYLRFPHDVLGGGWTNLGSDAKETVTLDASWQLDGPGRGDAVVEGGDIPVGHHMSITECWDGSQLRTYYSLDYTADPSQNQLEGNIASCPP